MALDMHNVTDRISFDTSGRTLRWGDVPKYDGRPVAFSALGSHGLWPTAGEHMYINVSVDGQGSTGHTLEVV